MYTTHSSNNPMTYKNMSIFLFYGKKLVYVKMGYGECGGMWVQQKYDCEQFQGVTTVIWGVKSNKCRVKQNF